MLFRFKNVGIIEEASIEVGGLTIITGLNDCGKSYITKSIFAIIKTVNEVNKQEKISRVKAVNISIDTIYNICQENIFFTSKIIKELDKSTLKNTIGRYIENDTPLTTINKLISNYKNKVYKHLGLLTNVDEDNNKNNNEKGKHTHKQLRIKKPQFQKDVEDQFKSLEAHFLYSLEAGLKSYFEKKIINKYFQDQFCNLDSSKATIEVYKGKNKLLNIEANNTNNSAVTFDLIDSIFYTDATLIETPIILQLSGFFRTLAFEKSSLTAEIPLHFHDITEKLFESTEFPLGKLKDLEEEILGIIGGKIKPDQQNSDIHYSKSGTKHEIKSDNIASGIKSFGLIQLLLAGGKINKQSVLIIDEPEVHLHPKWQIDYAKLIVDLCKLGIPVIVSSHSPYLLEAITKFADQNEVGKKMKVYFGDKLEGKNVTKFLDITDDLDPMYRKLAEPMIKLAAL